MCDHLDLKTLETPLFDCAQNLPGRWAEPRLQRCNGSMFTCWLNEWFKLKSTDFNDAIIWWSNDCNRSSSSANPWEATLQSVERDGNLVDRVVSILVFLINLMFRFELRGFKVQDLQHFASLPVLNLWGRCVLFGCFSICTHFLASCCHRYDLLTLSSQCWFGVIPQCCHMLH